ncbi:MAG TPA: PIN domain-containing protein [Burkholderiaceae bacterium]|jgi:hypothetical protein
MKFALLDASVMVALFDDADVHHERYVAKMGVARRSLATTWPCVTEASYILSPRNHLALLHWLRSGAAEVIGFDVGDLEPMMAWMEKYTEKHKTLMDLADASLVWLGSHLNCTEILSEDRRDFLRYRLPDGRAFEII